MVAEDRSPDWGIWKHASTAELWEAVALTLNIDPKEVRHQPLVWMAGPLKPGVRLFDEEPVFKSRLMLAERCLEHTLAGAVRGQTRRADTEISLQTFAAWAISEVAWDLPPELAGLAVEAASTGMPGRPGKSKELIDHEFHRRKVAGETLLSLSAEAGVLLSWLIKNHATKPRPTVGVIQNNIRLDHRNWKANRQSAEWKTTKI